MVISTGQIKKQIIKKNISTAVDDDRNDDGGIRAAYHTYK